MNKLYLLPIFLLSSSFLIAQSASEAGADLAKNPRLLEKSANLSNPTHGKQTKLSKKAAIAHKKRTQKAVHIEETAKATPSFPLEENSEATAKATPSFPLEENSEAFEEQVNKHEPKAETEKKRPRLKRPAVQLEMFQKEKERLEKLDLAETKKPEAIYK